MTPLRTAGGSVANIRLPTTHAEARRLRGADGARVHSDTQGVEFLEQVGRGRPPWRASGGGVRRVPGTQCRVPYDSVRLCIGSSLHGYRLVVDKLTQTVCASRTTTKTVPDRSHDRPTNRSGTARQAARGTGFVWTARPLFDHHGYEATSIGAILEASSATHGACITTSPAKGAARCSTWPPPRWPRSREHVVRKTALAQADPGEHAQFAAWRSAAFQPPSADDPVDRWSTRRQSSAGRGGASWTSVHARRDEAALASLARDGRWTRARATCWPT